MRVTRTDTGQVKVWASARDTYNWAHKPGAAWPCSTLSGNRFFAEFINGDLVDFALNGKDGDCDSHELGAFIQDHLGGVNPS